MNDLDELVASGAAIGGRSAADGRVPARRAEPPARLDRRALRGWRDRASAVGRCGERGSWPWRLLGLVGILALSGAHSSSGHWRAASSKTIFRASAARWIILAVIVITGLAQSALARVLDPVDRDNCAGALLSLTVIVHVFWLVWSGSQAGLVDKRVGGKNGVLICAGTCAVDQQNICGRMASRERKDHEAMGRLVLLRGTPFRGRVLNARFAIFAGHSALGPILAGAAIERTVEKSRPSLHDAEPRLCWDCRACRANYRHEILILLRAVVAGGISVTLPFQSEREAGRSDLVTMDCAAAVTDLAIIAIEFLTHRCPRPPLLKSIEPAQSPTLQHPV